MKKAILSFMAVIVVGATLGLLYGYSRPESWSLLDSTLSTGTKENVDSNLDDLARAPHAVSSQQDPGAIVQYEQVEMVPRTLAQRVATTEFIAEVVITQLSAGYFNTPTGLKPSNAISNDPSVDVPEDWDIFRTAIMDVQTVYKGAVTTTHIVAPLRGGVTGDGNELRVEGVSWSRYAVGQTVMLFGGRSWPPGDYLDLHWLTRASIEYDSLMSQEETPDLRLVRASCIYDGGQANCIEDLFSMSVSDLITEVDNLTP
jgi:hypothetical protein